MKKLEVLGWIVISIVAIMFLIILGVMIIALFNGW